MMRGVFNLLLNFAKVASFVPWIMYSKYEILTTLYPGVIAVGILAIHLFEMTRLPLTAFNISCSLFILSTISLSIHSAYFKRNCWKKMMKLYKITNQKIEDKFEQSLEPGWGTILMFVIYAILLTTMRIQEHVGDDDSNCFSMDLVLYIKLSAEYLVLTFLTLLLKGLKLLKQRTRYLTSDYRGHSLRLNRVTNLTVIKAIYCQKLYKNLHNMSDCFNEIFGWVLIASFLQFLITVLVFGQNLITLMVKERGNFTLSFFLWITFILRLVSRLTLQRF